MKVPNLTAYLAFDGNCAEAMHFYEQALHGKLEVMMTNGETPMAGQMPPGVADKIMHARLIFDDGLVLMAGDHMGGQPFQGMKGFSLTLTYPTVEEARRAFDALSEGGKVTMPFAPSFWADGFGMLTDRFGTPWIINGALKL